MSDRDICAANTHMKPEPGERLVIRQSHEGMVGASVLIKELLSVRAKTVIPKADINWPN